MFVLGFTFDFEFYTRWVTRSSNVVKWPILTLLCVEIPIPVGLNFKEVYSLYKVFLRTKGQEYDIGRFSPEYHDSL